MLYFRLLYFVGIFFYKNNDWISYMWNLDGIDFINIGFFEVFNSSCEF